MQQQQQPIAHSTCSRSHNSVNPIIFDMCKLNNTHVEEAQIMHKKVEWIEMRRRQEKE